jgi:hypothetical protein
LLAPAFVINHHRHEVKATVICCKQDQIEQSLGRCGSLGPVPDLGRSHWQPNDRSFGVFRMAHAAAACSLAGGLETY